VDFLAGCRATTKTPVFSLTAILTLALGIGANTAIFSLLYGLLLRSLPARSPDELANISIAMGSPDDQFRTSIPARMLEAFRARQHSFSGIGVWDLGTVNITDGSGILRLFDAGLVDGYMFDVLGIHAHLGRLISPADEVDLVRTRTWPVVLSYRFWRERFGGSADVIGTHIEISGRHAKIIGVTSPGFEGLSAGVEPKVYLPFQFISVISGRELLDDPSILYWCSAVGRLRPGVTLKQANAEAASLRNGLFQSALPARMQDFPEVRRARLSVRSARSGLRSEYCALYSESLYILQGLVFVVLVLCCVNVGGLMTARVYMRQHEFAVRAAIGAGRIRLTRQYLTESFVIALAGSALGGTGAWFGGSMLLRFLRDPTMFEAAAIHPDGMVFWITALSAVATTIVFGVFPALRASRTDSGLLLRSRSVGGCRGQGSVRAFIPVQVALSLALVAVATLLSQSLILLRGQHTGFDLDHVTIQTPPLHRLAMDGVAKLDLYQRIVDRIEGMPGVHSAAITWFTPMSGQQASGNFTVRDSRGNSFRRRSLAYNLVGPGYFRTMETRILEGREFAKRERDFRVCVLNRAAAADLFPGEAALGKFVENELSDALSSRASCRVVGVVEDAKFASLRENAPPTIYYPVAPKNNGMRTNYVFLMNANTKGQAIDAYSKALAEIAPSVPLVLFVTLREQMDAALGSQRLITVFSNLFAAVALFLSAIGLYGLISGAVAQRTREISVRIALGARSVRVVSLILSEAAALLGIGVGMGFGALFLSIRFLDKMLYGVAEVEPGILAGSFGLLAIVTLSAAAVPAIRAASLDPTRSLRVD
jgi:predicted permease